MKIKPKNIILESLSMILIIFGIEKLQVSFYSKEYEAAFKMDGAELHKLGMENIADLMFGTFYWSFGAFITVFLLIGTLKLWKNKKKGLLDTFLAFIIVFILFPIGFFNSGMTHGIINLVGGFFSSELRIRMLITGIFWTLVGIAIIWYEIKNTKHNNGYNL